MSNNHPERVPYMVFADAEGNIFEDTRFEAVGRSGYDVTPLSPEDFIELPFGSDLLTLPGRRPYGLHIGSGEFEIREDVVAAVLSAARSLDRRFIEAILRKDLDKYGVIDSWQEVMVPVLIIVGDEWARTGTGIEVEHLLSETIVGLMRDLSLGIKKPINGRPVLLASVGEELHCLALHALHAALAEQNIECHFLGARTPLQALANVVERSAPPAVFLWAQLTKNGDPTFFRDIPSIRPAPRFILGGPGWDREECVEVAFADDLTLACQEIKQAIGA